MVSPYNERGGEMHRAWGRWQGFASRLLDLGHEALLPAKILFGEGELGFTFPTLSHQILGFLREQKAILTVIPLPVGGIISIARLAETGASTEVSRLRNTYSSLIRQIKFAQAEGVKSFLDEGDITSLKMAAVKIFEILPNGHKMEFSNKGLDPETAFTQSEGNS